MAAELENTTENYFQAPSGDLAEDFSYKALSRAAILSIIFALLGALAWFSPFLLLFPFLAVLFAIIAFRSIQKYPTELTGSAWAGLGLGFGLLLLIVSPIRHTVIYLTEVPEGYERVSFGVLKSPMGAPDEPTPEALELNGKKIFLKGYIHPTSLSSNSAKSFVLVPDWATCCFGTKPPRTHMIEVRLLSEQFAQKSMRRHSLAGTFEVSRYLKQIEGLDGVFYLLAADHFQ